jgi:ABC-2 type transport system permease protein
MKDGVVSDTLALFRRSAIEGIRSPVLAFGFPAIFPLLIIALTSQLLRALVLLPGFPVHPYVAYQAPAVLLYAPMSSGAYSAIGVVLDYQTGFLDRVRLLSQHSLPVVLGRLLFDIARSLPAGVVIILASLALGARMKYGIVSVLALLLLLAAWSVAYNGLFYAVALKTRNPQAPVALLPVALPLLFMSPALIPKRFMPGWLKVASAWNPFTYVSDAARAFALGPVTSGVVLKALAATALVLALTQWIALRAFMGLVSNE